MKRLRAILAKGLEATADAWPDIREAFGWIRRFAAILANKPGLDADVVRRRFDGLPASLKRHGRFHDGLAAAFTDFEKAMCSHRPHIFAS